MTVVDCSPVPCSRPEVFGSGNAPASPGMPPGGPGLTGPARACAASGRPALASATAAAAWSAPAAWPDVPASSWSTVTAWRTARYWMAFGMPCGSRWTTATAASSGKPNSLVTSLSAWAAGDPGGISWDSVAEEVGFSGGRNTIAAATAAAHPPMTSHRRLTTRNAYPRASGPTVGRARPGGAGRPGAADCSWRATSIALPTIGLASAPFSPRVASALGSQPFGLVRS